MARQTGLIKIKGKIDDLSFYKTRDGHLVRQKSSLDGNRIANDPAFVRTRENGSEFGFSASAGKLLRDALRPMMMKAADSRVVSRVTKTMSLIKNHDNVNARGKRNVGKALSLPGNKTMLKGFNFNSQAVMGAVLFKPTSVTTATGVIKISNFTPVNDLKFPEGATDVSLTGAWAKMAFSEGLYDVQYSPATNIQMNATSGNVTLTPTAVPSITGLPSTTSYTDLYLLLIEFFQTVNGQQYSLKNGAYNALAILEVN